MKIILDKQFKAELKEILLFYSSKSLQVADKFNDELFAKIKSIAHMPYRFRKNQTLNKDNVRDLIYKGYVIPFKINDNSIKILSIYRYNLPSLLDN
ncbi:type II toxin-antitoxin system RelE/ParE family toxin [Helicobacter sp. 11S02629-2]|uniref:type II toxin-antitoxin system RelE/ParE family toxin n=1 Tax=Helicobacter sp. 11S02629-2 TaxID=1476195 RepID=UPI000BA791F0|nr:type II toxin-antitoxin system RelE/ParE family toxin [Helicobacter sp. 11S02629-2]PAF44377.1 hypothetical protein BKH40_05635 [Helicobacter sp. 11S02629-2]